jgi:hypothetical protein
MHRVNRAGRRQPALFRPGDAALNPGFLKPHCGSCGKTLAPAGSHTPREKCACRLPLPLTFSDRGLTRAWVQLPEELQTFRGPPLFSPLREELQQQRLAPFKAFARVCKTLCDALHQTFQLTFRSAYLLVQTANISSWKGTKRCSPE